MFWLNEILKTHGARDFLKTPVPDQCIFGIVFYPFQQIAGLVVFVPGLMVRFIAGFAGGAKPAVFPDLAEGRKRKEQDRAKENATKPIQHLKGKICPNMK